MGEILRLKGIELHGRGFLVSVTDVTSSPDLSYIKVYLSIFPPENRKAFFEQLTEHSKEIRRLLGDHIGKQVRHIPEIDFFIDDTQDYADKMDNLFKSIHIPKSDIEKFN
jgi:ribosome-binding factor A